jgi:hypothetical protein
LVDWLLSLLVYLFTGLLVEKLHSQFTLNSKQRNFHDFYFSQRVKTLPESCKNISIKRRIGIICLFANRTTHPKQGASAKCKT